MNYLNAEDHSQIDEQRMEDDLLDLAIHKVTDDLTYNSYRWQRSFYGLPAERLAKIFPRADKYEAMYQEEQKRKAA